MNKNKWITIFILLLLIGIASINPLEMQSYLLHQLGTVVMLIGLFYVNAKTKISTLAFNLYCGFLAVHIVAAHYLYSYVPYQLWTETLFKVNIDEVFGWQRNMFDRLVHFSYGFLLFPFFYQVFEAWLKPLEHYKKTILVCMMWVMASSMLYELLEWWIAIGMSAEEAEKYNGQQGDMWDAHKDMLLAVIGSIVAWLVFPQKMLKAKG
ncbi:DUF2238 domain-containing protein [Acinetobacter sp. MD2(2019)]|uniref:DUF2238 domain-containing protein n=1 Tax=Acinetobacter sp. MD2(2019) TaxID=2605273 RepID=UPI002D1F0A56|nr:DUF2238 domain-containing protein [Acinetobacter sp. MD2(2019)]MEB3753098.1 DUF2238 domain-containing protein [Acinetobacter sp. MD2(2019)]